MRIHHIVFKELWERKDELLTSFLAILLGIAVIVAVRTISLASKEKITEEMHNLGSNLLVIPRATKVSDYYTADFGDEVMQEKYADILNTSEFAEKVHEMIPKLSSKITIDKQKVILTGVLPKEEFKAKPKWKTTGWFKKERRAEIEPGSEKVEETIARREIPALKFEKKPKVKRKIFQSLGLREAILGSETAKLLGKKEGEKLNIKGREFTISQVFEATGTVDDIRIYAHLHTVQDLLGKGKVINAIEIVGCGCETDLIKLGRDIEKILPGTKAITIRHIAQTQSNTINLMEKFSLIVLIVVLIIGGASIANYMSSNIYQRRREIGTLLAIGATPNLILSIFLEKAILLSLVGGAFGYLVGTGLAVGIGPRIVKIIVAPQPILIIWSMAIAVVINVIFSLIPAKRAANLDPVRILQEV